MWDGFTQASKTTAKGAAMLISVVIIDCFQLHRLKFSPSNGLDLYPSHCVYASDTERNPSVLESEKSGIPIIEKGLLVLEVPDKSPAYYAGLRGVIRNNNTQKIENIGDIILSINDDDIIGPNDLNIILKKYNAGDKVIIKYLRDNKIKTSELTLGSYKGSTFTQLENERGKDFTDITNNINIPLKNIEPMIQPKL